MESRTGNTSGVQDAKSVLGVSDRKEWLETRTLKSIWSGVFKTQISARSGARKSIHVYDTIERLVSSTGGGGGKKCRTQNRARSGARKHIGA